MTSQSTFRFDGSSDDDARAAAAEQTAQDPAQPEQTAHDHSEVPHAGSPLGQEALDAVTQQVRDIAEVPAIEVITTSAVHLMSAAAVKCGLAEGPDAEALKDLDEARKLITALAGFVTAAAPEIGSQHAGPLRDGLRTLQLAFREASTYPDKPGQGPGEKFTGPVFS